MAVGQNMVKCQFCGTLYVDDQASQEEQYLTLVAYEQLRSCNFDEAIVAFNKVLSLYPYSFEGHFGKCLAKNKIVVYNNKRGERKHPRFFGDKIATITDDEGFVMAVKNAPAETAVTYNDIARRIEKIAKNSEGKTSDAEVVLCSFEFDKQEQDNVQTKTIERLNSEGISTYSTQTIEGREKEEDTFVALKNSQVFVLFANAKKGFESPEIKNLIDRYQYFISQKQKYAKSLLVVLVGEIKKEDLPDDLAKLKNIVKFEDEDSLFETIKKTLASSKKESAKIETIKVENVFPNKKEYVDVDTIETTDLGHYQVDNVETDSAGRIRWIFLALKNSDFDAAEQIIQEELKKDPNNSELLFAELMCKNKMRTAGEFFESVSNFQDKEKIDKILQYSTKEFAEMFVDNWERLLIKIDSEEYYDAFLLYLAKFNSSCRSAFVDAAENKAIESLNENLIEKVSKCFAKEDVDKFVDFYFKIAEHSDDPKYYQKVLEIDAGHEKSNLAMLLRNFKTNEDKLSYRDKEEIESAFKFLSEEARAQFVSAVIDLVMPVAFFDVDKAEEQLDFYLSYVTDTKLLVQNLKKVAEKFMEMGFFTKAEKYVSVAISKDKTDASLYWDLIKTKIRCQSDTEIITCVVDVTTMPEWDSILTLGNDEETEKYTAITSKAHLYKGEKQHIKEETPDLQTLKIVLRDFINRNNKILLEATNEQEIAGIRGVNYYRLQLVPFEKYYAELDACENYQAYKNLLGKINERLNLLDLTLDASISVVGIANKNSKGRPISHPKKERVKKDRAEKPKDHKKFWKRFCFVFLEMVPVLLSLLFLSFIVVDAKLVYMYLPQVFVFGIVIYSVGVAIVNLIYYSLRRKRLSVVWKVFIMILMIASFVNLILFAVDYAILDKEIQINNQHELVVLTRNANYSKLSLNADISLDKKWKAVNFYGNFDGNSHTISNVAFASKKGSFAFFNENGGTIKNLIVSLKNASYSKVTAFGGVCIKNKGNIESCKVEGSVMLNAKGAKIGGVASKITGGQIKNNLVDLELIVNITEKTAYVGGVVGEMTDNATILHNTIRNSIVVNGVNAEARVGGVIGSLGMLDSGRFRIEQNAVQSVSIEANGTIKNIWAGGLVGKGYSASKDNYTTGTIQVNATISERGYAGGLYGEYLSSMRTNVIKTSYSSMEITGGTSVDIGGLVGGKTGSIEKCYTTTDYALFNGTLPTTTQTMAENRITGYKTEYDFDPSVWDVDSVLVPPELK